MWWALGAAVVGIVLALVFGFDARRKSQRIGELEAENAELKAAFARVEADLALLDEPDPTDDELSDAARKADRADDADGVSAVERGRAEGLADLAGHVGRAAR